MAVISDRRKQKYQRKKKKRNTSSQTLQLSYIDRIHEGYRHLHCQRHTKGPSQAAYSTRKRVSNARRCLTRHSIQRSRSDHQHVSAVAQHTCSGSVHKLIRHKWRLTHTQTSTHTHTPPPTTLQGSSGCATALSAASRCSKDDMRSFTLGWLLELKDAG